MKYQVIWQEEAISALQRIISSTLDVQGLKNTVVRIGLELGARPNRSGESRDRGMRILFKYPLIVWFRVDERMKEVFILRVRPMRL